MNPVRGDGGGGDQARHQYMRRVLSVALQTAGFDGASAGALDILCAVGVHYMQNMFSQVHAYAEHATRTRPNMNDVGRALDERQVSVAQLDAYRAREAAAAQQLPVATAIDQLRRQARHPADAPPTASASAVFFDASAEELLCKLVGLYKSSADRPDDAAAAPHAGRDSDEDSDFEAPDVGGADAPDTAAAKQDEAGPAAEQPASAQAQGPATPPSAAAKAVLLPSLSLPDYIPPHCPLFPSPHTYRQTPVFPKREQDFFRTRMHKAEQSRQAEENLQRLISGPHAEWDASQDSPAGPSTHANHHPHKRIRHLFPPPNFRMVQKRTRLADTV